MITNTIGMVAGLAVVFAVAALVVRAIMFAPSTYRKSAGVKPTIKTAEAKKASREEYLALCAAKEAAHEQYEASRKSWARKAAYDLRTKPSWDMADIETAKRVSEVLEGKDAILWR